MGTRSLVRFYNSDGNILVVFYQQFDGYPDGVGFVLATFLKSITMTNGMSRDDDQTLKYANGIDCLAAQYCAQVKTQPGYFYIFPINSPEQEWNYDVHQSGNTIRISVNGGPRMTADQLLEYCTEFSIKEGRRPPSNNPTPKSE